MSFFRSKHSGWTHELRRTPFGGGNPISDLVNTVTNTVSDVGQVIQDNVITPISNAGVGLDKAVGSAIPGGWGTVGSAALAALTAGASLGATTALDAGVVASADATAAGMGFSSAAEAIQAGAITAEGLGLPAATTVADLGAVSGSASAGFVGSGAEAGVAGGVAAGAGASPELGTVATPMEGGVAQGATATTPAGAYGPGSAPVTDYSTAASASTQAGADQAAAAQAGYTPAQIAQAASKGISVAKLLQGAGSALGIIPAAANLFGGGLTGGGATSATDPYAQYRPQAAQQLNTLMNNPAQAMSQPGYQQQLQQGMQQAQRGAAATGQLQSGAEMNALQQQGQNTFGSYYNTLVGNLMQMSGAAQNPASAQTAAQQIAASKQNMMNQNLGTVTSGLGSIASLYGGSNPTSFSTSGLQGYAGSASDYLQATNVIPASAQSTVGASGVEDWLSNLMN